jgi:hypothetical protein
MPTTSSSISSSDELGADPWRRFASRSSRAPRRSSPSRSPPPISSTPYDTGRSPLFQKPGVRPQGPRTAAASRGCDPAVIGNSHIQALSPERLDVLTGPPSSSSRSWRRGRRSSSRSSTGSCAITHRCRQALVRAGGRELERRAVPILALRPQPARILAGLLRRQVLEKIPPRIRYLLSKRPARARPDGYWDYEPAGGYRLGRDRPQLHDPDLILDWTHYRRPLAELVERTLRKRSRVGARILAADADFAGECPSFD